MHFTSETLTHFLNQQDRQYKELENVDPRRNTLATSSSASFGLYANIRPFQDLTQYASSLNNRNLDENSRSSSMEDRQWRLRLSEQSNNHQR